MKQPISAKPEPRTAQSNWSYNAYFLSQLKGLETVVANTSVISNSGSNSRPVVKTEQRHQVIAKMEALAASIGVHITIVNQAPAL